MAISTFWLLLIMQQIKWVEAKALKTNMVVVIVQFIYEFIIAKFGCPFTLVSDQGTHIINEAIKILTTHFLIRHM